MKRIFVLLLAVSFLTLAGCSSEQQDGISPLSSSSKYEGLNYQEVVDELNKAGFTEVETSAVDDLITGWLTKDGEVEKVEIDGDANFSPDDKFSKSAHIVVTYHTFPDKGVGKELDEEPEASAANEETEETILTSESCEDFAKVLSTKYDDNATLGEFAKKYAGRTVEFDGCITYLTNHDSFDTRYDLLLSAGDYVDENTVNPGALFKFEDVNAFDMGIKDLYLPSFMAIGSDIHITAKVLKYDGNLQLLYLDPVLVVER